MKIASYTHEFIRSNVSRIVLINSPEPALQFVHFLRLNHSQVLLLHVSRSTVAKVMSGIAA